MRVSGITRGASSEAAIPIGTLIRKQLRQPRPAGSRAISAPPTSWPPTAATSITVPYTLSALTRAGPVKRTPMIDSTFGAISAAATPCTSLATTSSVGVLAAPQPADASVNSARPAEKLRRRPKRSPRRAEVTTKIAEVSAYPATIHSIAPGW